MAKRETLFSGIQPTNQTHIGNYIGALKQWVELQSSNNCLFCIVDLHAITVPQNPEKLREDIRSTAATYLAVGLDPKKCTIFVQSDVPEHAELGWIMGTVARMSELERMTQFKDKAKKQKENVSVGLFTYPALMSADILLYDTTIVPVGEDQMQHVELARTLARRFNTQFGETFNVPHAVIQKTGARIMSLDDPKTKMSKSGTLANAIFLSDAPDVITRKIMRAVTDSGKGISFDPTKKPAISNLMTIFHHVTGDSMEKIEQDFGNKGYGDFKKALAEATVEYLTPIRKKREMYMKDQKELDRILKSGAETAHKKALKKIVTIRKNMGLGR
ncbi:MAG: tryptophan--tRNA ligase [bacterium]|nr:tryptophan--tRNA ligase [bacterium]